MTKIEIGETNIREASVLETLNNRLEAIDLLLNNGYGVPAVILMRPVIEHMLNVILIDKGLWDAARNGKPFPRLRDAYYTLENKNRHELTKVFGKGSGFPDLLRRIGNSATHNHDDVDIAEVRGCRHFLDAFLARFAEKYPDEQYFHSFTHFSKALIEVTHTFTGKVVTMKSRKNDCYVSVDNDSPAGDMLCQVTTADSWERFEIGEGYDKERMSCIGFRGVNKKWLSADIDDGGILRSNAEELSWWECFRVYKSGLDFYIMSSQNGKWVVFNANPARMEATGQTTDNAFLIETAREN